MPLGESRPTFAPITRKKEEIETGLREAIPYMNPKQKLPSVIEFADQYRCSTHTVQQALRSVQKQGMIKTISRKGSFVREKKFWKQTESIKEGPKTPYQIVEGSLLCKIVAGEYLPESQLPSEVKLMEEYGTTRYYIRKALRSLTEQEIIVSETGRGTYVSQNFKVTPELVERTNDFISQTQREPIQRPYNSQKELLPVKIPLLEDDKENRWAKQIRTQGKEPSQKTRTSRMEPPAAIAKLLEMESEDEVIVNRRSRFVNKILSDITNFYFPEGIIKELGFDIQPFETNVKGEITSRKPTKEEKTKFRLHEDVHLLVIIQTSYDENDRPIRVREQILPADRGKIIFSRGEKS